MRAFSHGAFAVKNLTKYIIFNHIGPRHLHFQNVRRTLFRALQLCLESTSGVVISKPLACKGLEFKSRSCHIDIRYWVSPASKSRYDWNIVKTIGHSCHISRRETKSHGFSAVLKSHAVGIVSHRKWNDLPFCCYSVIPSAKTAIRPIFKVARLLFTPAVHWCVERVPLFTGN